MDRLDRRLLVVAPRGSIEQAIEAFDEPLVLIAGGNFVHPAYMDAVVVYGFAAAVIGGLDSPVGSVVGGLALGILFSLVAGYVGSQLLPLTAFAILMVVLLLKPDGIFSRTATRRV